MICSNVSRFEDGTLAFSGQSVTALADRYGTPLYLMDEDRIRHCCRAYQAAVQAAFHGKGRVLYASKAASFKRIYEIMKEEGMACDVVSCGEIFTAKSAGFPMDQTFFHSNNKTDEDIAFAMDCGVGYFVVDNREELFAIEEYAEKRGIRQKVLLRITPGIDPHTYEEVATGKVDSKFGSAIETGQAESMTQTACQLSHVELVGYHCHVGSQVFDADVFLRAADVMLMFCADMAKKFGNCSQILDIGGGFGVRYTESQPTLNIEKNIAEIGSFIVRRVEELSLPMPVICFEPGRSIVADAGMTVYTVGTVKKIPGYKNYVSVDGGMTDNIRYALYKADYTILHAERTETAAGAIVADVVGRCCESGDIIQKDVTLPADIRRGERIVTLTTGAYNYSMASNYNRIPRPPVIMLSGGESYVAVRRETLEDIVRLDG